MTLALSSRFSVQDVAVLGTVAELVQLDKHAMEPENVVAVPTIPVVVLGTVVELVQLDRHVMEPDNVVAVPTIPVVPAMPVAQQTERPRPPLNMLDVENAVKYQDSRREKLPTGPNLLGPFTVGCLVLNRTIGRRWLLRQSSPMCWRCADSGAQALAYSSYQRWSPVAPGAPEAPFWSGRSAV